MTTQQKEILNLVRSGKNTFEVIHKEMDTKEHFVRRSLEALIKQNAIFEEEGIYSLSESVLSDKEAEQILDEINFKEKTDFAAYATFQHAISSRMLLSLREIGYKVNLSAGRLATFKPTADMKIGTSQLIEDVNAICNGIAQAYQVVFKASEKKSNPKLFRFAGCDFKDIQIGNEFELNGDLFEITKVQNKTLDECIFFAICDDKCYQFVKTRYRTKKTQVPQKIYSQNYSV